ncbi:hypothetical protein PINS_up002095 [Pythium insidiosum]|nr:hypothetical protein PINS_up002095 [Pythium insidiosum]
MSSASSSTTSSVTPRVRPEAVEHDNEHDNEKRSGDSDVRPAAITPVAVGPRVTSISTERKSTVASVESSDAYILSEEAADPWKAYKKINYVNVIVSLVTYGLLLTDIPRTGTETINTMRTIGTGFYAYLGSYAYELLTYRRDPVTGMVTATSGGSPVPTARVWSYKYDTTSTTTRLMAKRLDETKYAWLPCLNYRKHTCSHEDPLPLDGIFPILDGIVDLLSDDSKLMIPGVPTVADPRLQHTRHTLTYKVRRTDLLYEFIIMPLLDRLEMYTAKMSYFRNLSDPDLNVCADPSDRPFHCDAGIYSDYRVLAEPKHPPSVAAKFIWRRVHEQVADVRKELSTHGGNLSFDMAILDSYVHPVAYTGGIVLAGTMQSENVLLIRARECDPTKCETIFIRDYRFESAQVISDFVDWGRAVSVLRIAAQCYFYVRLVTLVWACHFSAPRPARSLWRTLLLALSEAPSHVVAYGSPFPILAYAFAHCMDANITNIMVIVRSIKLQGDTVKNPQEVFLIICLLMRRQWLLSAISWIWVHLQTMMAGWSRREGVLSVRGHVFGILGSMSVALGYRSIKFRDTRVLAERPENPDPAVMLASINVFDPMGQRHSGVYSDMMSLFLCAVAFGAAVLLLQILVYPFLKHRTSRGMQRALLDAFCARTDYLPSMCGKLWGVGGFICAWNGDFVLTVSRAEEEAEATRRTMLLNIVLLSDPLVLASLYAGLNRARVYRYRDLATGQTFLSMEKMQPFGPKRSDKYERVETFYADSIPFHELVRCN